MDPAEVWDTRCNEVYKWGKKDFVGTPGALNEVCWSGAGKFLCDCWVYIDMGSRWDTNSLFGKLCQDETGFEGHNVISSPVFALYLLRYTEMCCMIAWPGSKSFVLCSIWKHVWKQLIDYSRCDCLYRNAVFPGSELDSLPRHEIYASCYVLQQFAYPLINTKVSNI